MARPVELNGRTSRFTALASICLVVAALYFARDVLIPLALAVLFTFLLSPLVRQFERLKLPRVAATLIVIALAIGGVVSLGFVVGQQIESVVKELPKYEGQLKNKIAGLRKRSVFFWKAEHEFHNFSNAVAASQPSQGAGQPVQGPEELAAPTTQPVPVPVRIVTGESGILETIGNWGASVLSPLATAALVLVLLIFMLFKREDLRDRMIRLIGHGRLNLTTQAVDEAGSRISRYLGALSIVNCCFGLCVAAGLWAAGRLFGQGLSFPDVLVWGLLVALLRFVPYIGVWIGASIPILLSFAIFPGSGVFFAVIGMFVILEVTVGQFVEPYWYGSSTGMSALAVLVAAIFWTWLWGGIGLLLSTPMTVCLLVMGKYVPQFQFLDILLGDEPVLPPEIRVYQRLIADDEDEAAEIAREELKKSNLESVYDQILIPVLAMAEIDHHRHRMETDRLEFIRQSIREMTDELGDEAKGAAENRSPEEGTKPAHRPALPKDCSIYVTVLPARNESDQIIGEMLAQLLALRGYCAIAGSAELLASELVDFVDKNKTQIICVSALPPAAVGHARYLCKKLQARGNELPMLIGLWTLKSDPQRVQNRIACTENVRMATSFAQAQHEIGQLAQRFIATGAARNGD